MLRRGFFPIWKLVLMATVIPAAFLLLVQAAPANPSSIVVNGSFEEPVVDVPYVAVFPPGFDGWTVDSGSVDIVDGLWPAASGAQSVDLNGNCCDAGSISQALPTNPGATYTLSFSFAGNPDPNPICQSSPQIKRMEVFWGGTSIGVFTFDTAGHTLADIGWQRISVPVTAGTSSTTLRFTSLIPGACGPTIDDVAVAEGANRPPDCSTVTASPSMLSPANRELRLVNVSGATDPDADTVTLTITAVTQDEPLTGDGDNTSVDAFSKYFTSDPFVASLLTNKANEVYLRAETSKRGDGRVYRIAFTGSDGRGGTCSGTANVAVPSKKGLTVDSAPPSYDSFAQ